MRNVRWTEIIAALGVMLSLIFVGMQIRQNTAAIEAAAFQQLSDQNMQLNIALAENPEMARAYGEQRGMQSPDPRAVPAFIMRNMHLIERDTNPLLTSSRFPDWWARNRKRFAADFQARMDSVVARASTPGDRRYYADFGVDRLCCSKKTQTVFFARIDRARFFEKAP